MYVQTSQKSPTRIPPNVLSTGIQLEHICSETKTSQACVVLLMCIYSRCTMKDFLVNLFFLWFCSFLWCGMTAELVILVLSMDKMGIYFDFSEPEKVLYLLANKQCLFISVTLQTRKKDEVWVTREHIIFSDSVLEQFVTVTLSQFYFFTCEWRLFFSWLMNPH